MKQKKIVVGIWIIACLFIIIGSVLWLKNDNSDSLTVNYPYIGKYKDGFVAVSDGKKLYYMNQHHKISKGYDLIDLTTIDLSSYYYQDGLAPYNENGLMGLIDEKNNIIVKADYQKIQVIDENTILVTDQDNNTYFINQKGEKISEGNFYDVQRVTNDVFNASQNSKKGVITTTGQVLIPFDYDQIISIQVEDSIYFVAITSTVSAMDHLYKYSDGIIELIPIDFTFYLQADQTYLYLIDQQGKYILYNYHTNQVKKLINSYEILGSFDQSLALVTNEQKMLGFINDNEELVIPYIYLAESSNGFDQFGYAVVSKENGSVGLINQKNETILPFEYKDILVLSKDIIAVAKTDNQYQIQRLNGKMGKNVYDYVIKTIRDDYYIIMQNGKYGLIDNQGNEFIKPKYLEIQVLEDQVLLKESKNKYIIHFFKEAEV